MSGLCSFSAQNSLQQYEQVTHDLEFARELHKQFGQIIQEVLRDCCVLLIINTTFFNSFKQMFVEVVT